MTKIKTKVTTVTSKDHILEVTELLLLEVLREKGYEIPPNAEVYVQVPGGGDWSNTSLDVDKECPVFVRWQEQDTKVTGDG